MTAPRTQRHLAVPVAVIAVVLAAGTLASCTGGDDGASEAPPSGSASAVAPSAEEASTSEPSATASSETSESSGPADPGIAACLLGDWEMDNAARDEQVAALLGVGGDVEVSTTGYARMTIDATTVRTDVDATSTFAVSLGEEVGEMTGETVTAGSMTQAYTLTGDQLTFGETTDSDGGVSVTSTMPGGEAGTTEYSFEEMNSLSPGVTVTVTCEGDTLTFVAPSGEGVNFNQPFVRR